MMLIFMYDVYCYKTASAQPIKIVLTLSYDGCHSGQHNQAKAQLAFMIVYCKNIVFFFIKAFCLSHLSAFVGS